MFDWKTADEDQWDEVVAETPPPPPRKRPWVILAAILLLAAVAGGVIYGQLNQRIAANKEALTADLAASQTVITLAATQRDVELFRNLVARTDYEWARTQDQLIERGLFLDRTTYGLALGDTDTAEVVDVLTSPQQTRTRVTTAYPYTIATAETIWLYHVAVYEQRSGRWRLAPPDEAFWGEMQTIQTGTLVLHVPTREVATWERVAPHLEASFNNLCEQVTCLPNTEVTLSTDPATMVEMVGRESNYFHSLGFPLTRPHLILPTLTQFGLPSDEAATEAVAHAYASQIVIGTLARMAYNDQRAIDQVLLERRLDELGLRPWPLTPADYARYFKEPFPVNEIPFQTITNPRLTERDWWRLYLLGDYLTYVRQFHPDILTQSRLNPQGWLGEPALNPSGEGRGLFLDFLAARGGLENRPSPIPLPSQSVWLDCSQGYFSYLPATAEWQEGIRPPTEETPAFNLAESLGAVYPSPNQSWHLLASSFDPAYNASAATAALPPTPQLLLATSKNEVVESLGEGYAPFWLDDEMLGWARPRSSGGVDVVQRPLAGVAPFTLLAWEELAAHLPPNYVSTPFLVWHIAPLPQNPDLLLLILTTDVMSSVPEIPWQGSTHLLLYEWRTGTWRKTLSVLGKAWEMDWSPDGRSLLLHATRGYNSVLEMPTLAVLDSWEHTISPNPNSPNYSWSADSQWFLHLNDGFLTLTAPAHNYQHILRTSEMNDCLAAGWE